MEGMNGTVTTRKDAEDKGRILLNVGGFRHETYKETLLKYPNTKLGKIAASANGIERKEIFFDRDPVFFPSILNYYRTGTLHIPSNLCGPAINSELKFWDIKEKYIEECCWIKYSSFEDTKKILDKFVAHKKHNLDEKNEEIGHSWSALKTKLRSALADPYSSRAALVFAVCSTLVVLLSIVVFVSESMPRFGYTTMKFSGHEGRKNLTSSSIRNAMNIFENDDNCYRALLILDNICNLFFFAELLLGLITAPSKLSYLRSPFAVLEIFCIVPYYIAIVVVFVHPEPRDVYYLVLVLMALRVLRIFRIFKLMKHFRSFNVLLHTMQASTKELLLLIVLIFTGVIIFGCLEYYAELISANETDFKHIPLSFWWALVTMTTVGYGDIVPKSWFGHLIGSVCVISGVLFVALSLSVIVNNFAVLYSHAQSRALLIEKSKENETEKLYTFHTDIDVSYFPASDLPHEASRKCTGD